MFHAHLFLPYHEMIVMVMLITTKGSMTRPNGFSCTYDMLLNSPSKILMIVGIADVRGSKQASNFCKTIALVLAWTVWSGSWGRHAFTLLGLLSQKTVLMEAAQDGTNHEEA